jgi:hypothetical protein
LARISRFSALGHSRHSRLPGLTRLTRLSRLTRLTRLSRLTVVWLAGRSSVARTVGLSSSRAGLGRCRSGSCGTDTRRLSRVSGCGLSSWHGSLRLGSGLSAGRRRCTVSGSARAGSAERDLNTLVLARGRHGVDVVFAIVVDGAGVELSASVVGDAAVRNSEASSWGGTNIALELGSGRSEDTSAAVGVGETTTSTAIAGQAVAAGRVVTADTVLAVTKLTKDTRCASR